MAIRRVHLPRLCAVLLGATLAALPASAGTYSGTLNAPSSNGTSSLTWNGGPLTGSYVGTVATVCTAVSCDTYNLNVNVSSTFYASNPNYAIHVTANWASNVNDFDVYVYDAAGNLVCSSAQGFTNSEDADCGQLPSGNYTVNVDAWIGTATTYAGAITLGPEPTTPSGKARYKPGAFTFSSPQLLPGPPDLLFNQQGVEPRVMTDPVGNIYAAAIQGIPAGTDTWKSMDGGNTWTYLGQPDGTQALAATATRGGGAGGGDEDLAVSPNGLINITSLWLGSATESTSKDGGAIWTENPFSSDVPLIDREWIASYGNNVIYLTYKQLGVLLAGTETVFVAKSFDGGITFPQVVPVTTPEMGIQPGDQGNITVDPNNGNVYTLFVGQQEANTIYLAKSTDGGQTWTVSVAVHAASGSLANVFPIIAVDAASNLHIVYSDGANIHLTSSQDGGATWTMPVRVNNGPTTKTALAPWVVAGASGKLNITWWGTSDSSSLDTAAQWQVFMAQTQNALANVPLFSQAAATGIMHTGAICVDGTGCPSGTRNLAEYFAPGLYVDGNELIVYSDDQNNPAPMATFTRQVSGPTIQK